ncbi:MAG: YraN family protein [Bacteroides sp.]|nr:YraN family protein [Bacteroides sp.]
MGSCEEDIPGSRDTQQKQEAEKAHENKRIAAAWGKYAEAMAAQYLLKQGLPLREWDWSPGPNSKGEIDLISQKGDTIIFVEVKARCGKHDDPWEAIDTKKIRRLCRGANIYLQRQNEFFKYQFDVALLTGSYDDFVFEYIEDAFLCPPTSRGH